MKKQLLAGVCALALGVTAVAGMAGCGSAESALNVNGIAMITDSGDINDKSFNQTTYEACKAYAQAKKLNFKYYKPADDSTADRVKSIEEAIAAGSKVVVMPGYLFAGAIRETVLKNRDVTFIALDVSEYDLTFENDEPVDFTVPSNLVSYTYCEELAGYMAGYAAVAEGYKSLGFLGGMAVPAVVRYGYGYVLGADAAAQDKGVSGVTMKYIYGGKFSGDENITNKMNTWCTAGTEVIFACGGGIYTSAAQAAKDNGKKVIGVDVDQKATIDDEYGKGITVTSAMKGLAATVTATLDTYYKNGKYLGELGGQVKNMGLVTGEADKLDTNYVGLPTAGWSMTHFTLNDYKALVAGLAANDFAKANAISANASSTKTEAEITAYASHITIDFQGTIS